VALPISRLISRAPAGLLAFALAACAAAPRQTPLPIGAPDTGAGTVTSARQALEGRWVLQSFAAASADGRRTAVESDGVLTLDNFGNLRVDLRLTDAGRAALTGIGVDYPATISTEGRVVIDTQQHKIVYVAPGTDTSAGRIDPALAARRANPFALERDRWYAIADDGVLTLTTKHDSGSDAAISRWKRP
jgi:hypothetical protein